MDRCTQAKKLFFNKRLHYSICKETPPQTKWLKKLSFTPTTSAETKKSKEKSTPLRQGGNVSGDSGREKPDSATFCKIFLISFMKVQIPVHLVNSPAELELEGTVPPQLLLLWH